MNQQALLVIVISFVVGATAALAQKPIVYPAKGQSSQQKAKDDADCRAWAKKDTGIDPVAASAPAPQQTGPATGGGERVRGAARGAVGGTMAGGAKARQNQAAQNQQAQQQQQQTLNTFYRAYGACMEGRGYSIK